MLTLEQLRAMAVNLDIAKEALSQSEKRLGDALDAKKMVEQKATVLFGAYVTISLALFGFAGTLARDPVHARWAVAFFIAGTVFVCGAAAFALVFRSAEYGNFGSEPSMWLQAGRIDGDHQALARMFAYLAHHHATRIEKSYASNAVKSRRLHIGMMVGVAGAISLPMATAFIFFCSFAVRP